jgi:uncharacterized coiled-coil protein SlyX/outer membrane protein W
MQIQKIKMLTLASTLALSLGMASAQTEPAAAPAAAAPVTLTDVPAGHWAKDAVDLIVQKGLIQGFPDGTFRGNENLTRYQAALIFYRLLQTGALSSGAVTPGDTTTIANGMQEVSTELASVSSRVTDLEKLSADQQTRIAALETQIATLTTGAGAAGGADTAALTARIDALEASVSALPADGAAPANTTDLEARLAALEAAAAAPATTTPTTEAPATETTEPVVIGDTGATTETTAVQAGRLFVGAHAAYTVGKDQTGVQRLSYGAVVGTTQAIGPVGAQVSVDYAPANNVINADADATLHLFPNGSFDPYIGVGFGLTSSKARDAANPNAPAAAGAASTVDYSANGLAGIDYRFTDSIGVYAEIMGRYYITNKGTGTYLQGTKAGFGGTGKAGLKFFF